MDWCWVASSRNPGQPGPRFLKRKTPRPRLSQLRRPLDEKPTSERGDPCGPYTGRFFRRLFCLYPYQYDGPPCASAVSPAVALAFSAASAPWPQEAFVRAETAAATPPATTPLAATLLRARPRPAGTAARASHNSAPVHVAPWFRSPPSDAPHASLATAPGACSAA